MSKDIARSHLPARAIRISIAVCGWILFAAEWIRVASRTPHSDEIVLAIALGFAFLMIHAGIYAWVGHNKRIAARGTRGTMTRYASPEFLQDHLGRTLVIGQETRQSQEIIVSIEGNSKVYRAAQLEIAVSTAQASETYSMAESLR